MGRQTFKQFAIERVVKARRNAKYTQKELGYRLGLTTKEVQSVERAELTLGTGQIRVWAEIINVKESWIIEQGFWNRVKVE